MSRDRLEEDAARYVVQLVESVALIPRDVKGAPSGTHDFDVERAGVVAGALEVTMLEDEERRGFIAAIDQHGYFEASELARSWLVAPTKDAIQGLRVKTLRRDLIPILQGLEAAGIGWMGRDDPAHPFDDLPISFVSAHDTEGTSRVALLGPTASAMVWSGSTHAGAHLPGRISDR
jgi:hypothetical protein